MARTPARTGLCGKKTATRGFRFLHETSREPLNLNLSYVLLRRTLLLSYIFLSDIARSSINTESYTLEGKVGEGLFGSLKAHFWRTLAKKRNYLRALRAAESALSKPWLWSKKRILFRLESLERLAFWKEEDWRGEREIDSRRTELMRTIQGLCGPRLREIDDWGEKRRLNRFLSQVESRLEVPTPYCRPRICILEFTNQCNLRCSMCPQSFREWERSYAGEEILERARGLYPWLEVLDLTSFGESLLSPLFWKALKEAPPGVRTKFMSNGHLVDPSVAERLVGGQLSSLQISLDAVSRETYRDIRGVDGLEKVLGHCKAVVAAKERHSSLFPCLEFKFTMRRSNIDELIPLIQMAAEIGFQGVEAHFLIVATPEVEADSLHPKLDRVRTVLEKADRVARDLGVRFTRPPVPGLEGGVKEGGGFCLEPWEMLFLRATGEVSVCSNSPANFHLLSGESLEDLWDGPKYQQFRRVVNLEGKDAPPICRSCRSAKKIGADDPRYHFVQSSLEEHWIRIAADSDKAEDEEPA
jgi:MoaA/NifB/PqqE/SkfB family radical SAM enzyme